MFGRCDLYTKVLHRARKKQSNLFITVKVEFMESCDTRKSKPLVVPHSQHTNCVTCTGSVRIYGVLLLQQTHQVATHTHVNCSLDFLTDAHTHTHTVSGLHANGAIQPDDLAVNHGVLGQRCHQVGELCGVSQAWGEGHLSGQEGAHLLWEPSQQRGGEQTWRNDHKGTFKPPAILNPTFKL